MRRLICVFSVRICLKARFRMARPIDDCVNALVFYLITKTCLYNFDPLKAHIYIVKLGFTGVQIIFLISARKHRLWYSLEPPRRGGPNEYPQSMFWAEIWKISVFLFEFFQFLEVEFSVYLNRHAFVMSLSTLCDRRVIIKNYMQWNVIRTRTEFRLQWLSEIGSTKHSASGRFKALTQTV